MAINPNIPDTIVVGGLTVPNTADPKWIDGGTAYTDPTFNIDDPTMWLPMTVISGLASGFCERAAVVSSNITGFPTNLTWTLEAPREDAANSAQVVKVANNIAMHGGTATIFTATTNPLMQTPGTAAGSNYMTTFDSAISSLIATGGFKKRVVNGGEVSYTDYTFATLAQDAKARAGNDISLTPQANGANIKGTMKLAYPAEWAKERKWMLDELKYTEAGVGYVRDVALPYSAKFIQTDISSTDIGIEAAFAAAMENAELVTDDTSVAEGTFVIDVGLINSSFASPFTVVPSDWGNTADPLADQSTVVFTPADTTVTSDTEIHNIKNYYITGISNNWIDFCNGYNFTVQRPIRVDLESRELSGKTITIDVFIKHPRIVGRNDVFFSSYLNAASVIVSGQSTFTTTNLPNNAAIIVVSGGTATINSGVANTVIVEPHGTLVMGSTNASVVDCCILTKEENNTRVSGTVVNRYRPNTTRFDAIQSCYVDFTLAQQIQITSGIIIDQDTTYTPINGVNGVIVQSGVTCTLPDSTDGETRYPGEIRVEPGGVLVAGSNLNIERCTLLPGLVPDTTTNQGNTPVMIGASAKVVGSDTFLSFEPGNFDGRIRDGVDIHSGATCTFIATTNTNTGMRYVTVYSGGTLILNSNADLAWSQNGVAGGLYVEEGAVVKLISNLADPGTAAPTVISVPRTIVEYKYNSNPPALRETKVGRFITHGMELDHSLGALHTGWNTITVSIPNGQTACTLMASTGVAESLDPILQPMYTATTEAGTTLLAGFNICTIRITSGGAIDHYQSFRCRQFYANPDIVINNNAT